MLTIYHIFIIIYFIINKYKYCLFSILFFIIFYIFYKMMLTLVSTAKRKTIYYIFIIIYFIIEK
jgi:hypothetical protein